MSDPIAPKQSADGPGALPSSVEFRPRGDIHVDPADWAARAAAVRAGLAAEGLPASDMFEALNGFRFLDDAGAMWTYNGTDWSSWNGTTWVTSAQPASLKLQPFSMDLVPEAPDSVPALASSEPAVEAAPVVEVAPALVAPAAMVVPVPVVAPTPGPVPAAAPLPASPAVVPQPSPVPAQQPAQRPSPVPPNYRPSHLVPHTGMPAWSQPDPRVNPVTQLGPSLDVMVVEWQPSGWARIVCSNQWSGWVDGRLLVPWGQQPYGYGR